MNPPALYFAKHEDLWKTNLKAPLNPSWMIESLDVGSINQNKITSYKEEDDILYLYEKRQTADGTDCLFLTVINKKENKVCARKLLDNSMRTIISTIYKDDIISETIIDKDNVSTDNELQNKCNIDLYQVKELLNEITNMHKTNIEFVNNNFIITVLLLQI